jgi:DNA-binding protein H-NS
MAKTYAQIQQQIDRLQREAEKLKRQEVDGVIVRIKEAIDAYGLTAADLGLANGRAVRAKGRRVAAAKKPAAGKHSEAKFRDQAGNTWGGRGPRPQWLKEALSAGRQLSDFAV